MTIKATEKDFNALITHLQDATELKDTALAYELHDELGALMGAAIMDLDAVRRIKPPLSAIALERLDRVRRTLQQAIDLKRRVIEELRPSILDNFGLCAALRWQLKRTWTNSSVVSTETYPDIEPNFDSRTAITLFRIAQGALSMALKHASVTSTDLTVRVGNGDFSMSFSDNGNSQAAKQSEEPSMILAAMRHRIRALGGHLALSRNAAGTTVLTASMPFSPAAIAAVN